jgi:hypothetical protein
MLERDVGYNVSAERVFREYPTIGETQTYVTDKEAIANVIGEFEGGGVMRVPAERASVLEEALGLDRGILADDFRITIQEGLSKLDPQIPTSGNRYWRGPGQGLPGGGPELVVKPPIPTSGGPGTRQILVKVIK